MLCCVASRSEPHRIISRAMHNANFTRIVLYQILPSNYYKPTITKITKKKPNPPFSLSICVFRHIINITQNGVENGQRKNIKRFVRHTAHFRSALQRHSLVLFFLYKLEKQLWNSSSTKQSTLLWTWTRQLLCVLFVFAFALVLVYRDACFDMCVITESWEPYHRDNVHQTDVHNIWSATSTADHQSTHSYIYGKIPGSQNFFLNLLIFVVLFFKKFTAPVLVGIHWTIKFHIRN